MSIVKRAWLQGEQGGDPLIQVVKPGQMVKTASALVPEVQDYISKIQPDPCSTYTLVNAMGYSEYFGANSNKDWYGYNKHLCFNGLLHAPPDWGIDPCKDMVRGKKWLFGYPTFYGASVYAHHKNQCPKTLGFGDVVFVMPNHRMKRIELVMRVDNALAEERGRTSIIDRIYRNERVDVSMGAKVPFDLCSICTDWDEVQKAWQTFNPGRHLHPGIAILQYHRTVKPIRGLSVTRKDYCEHMRLYPGQILSDGQKVFVYNDFPRFFDISFVWIGADKTARVMLYMGNRPDDTLQVRQQTEITPGPITMIQRRRVVVKTAMEKRAGDSVFFKQGEIEKEIPAYAKKIELHALQEPDMPFDLLSDVAGQFGAKSLLSTLGSLGIALKPREFHVVVTKGRPMSEKLAHLALSKGAEFTTDTSDVDDTYSVEGGQVNQELAKALKPMADSRSSFAPHLGLRLKTAPGSSVLRKESSILTSDLMNELGAQYNGYRLSLLEQAPEVFPKYAQVWDLDPEQMLKVGSLGMAPLLLGLGPMIHLVSAHLRKKRESGKELGTMAKFVADNPTFLTMSTIGAGLRAAMAVQKAGGLAAAAKGVVSALRMVA